MKNMLSPRMSVKALMKIRPMSISMLEKRNIRFWGALDKTLDELFRRESLDDFLDEVAVTRFPAHDTDWNALPLFYIVDYLTQEHRNFLLQEVRDIQHLFDIHTIAESPEGKNLRKVQKAFKDFVKNFQAHIEEEEGFLFPKILRYEACLRDRTVHPEFHGGSLQTYLASRNAQEGKAFYRECDMLADRMRFHQKEFPACIAAAELVELVDLLREKLNAHYELETAVLYPIGRELERNLYNLSIDGDPAVAYQRRGPMDSGILRLDDG